MKPHPDAVIIFNKIKKDSGLNDEALALIGITPQKLTTSYKQCVSKGLSRRKAMETIFKLWKQSDPEIKEITGKVSAKEMDMMGFELTPLQIWKHTKTGVEISKEALNQLSFEEIEAKVLNKMNESGTK